ncbi:MAG: D-aminoacyl-tRNA deacylase [Candidatus Thermoplasmatota archaeon]|nr:D-aminoacyl-tRNA deacylase [Candidatus Thermoplasmatota archaeon]
MRAILACTGDPASLNIRDCLLSLGSWDRAGKIWNNDSYISGEDLLCLKDGSHLDFDLVDSELLEQLMRALEPEKFEGRKLGIDNLVFLSKHRSEKGVDSLTVHAPGNYSEARYGGRPHTLPPSSPREMSAALRCLRSSVLNAGLDENVSFEVTHHGPYLSTPSFFIEIGSVEDRWVSRELGEVIASSLLQNGDRGWELPIAIGIGGGHYSPRFSEAALRSIANMGHMIPDHHMTGSTSDRELAGMAVLSTPGCEAYILHETSRNRDVLKGIEPYLRELGLSKITC